MDTLLNVKERLIYGTQERLNLSLQNIRIPFTQLKRNFCCRNGNFCAFLKPSRGLNYAKWKKYGIYVN